jgi:AhpD family alkylhydroperoxidase
MDKNFADITRRISSDLRKLRKDIPDVMQGFSALAQAASRDGALDKKTKELMALALGVAARCDGCIGFHAEALARRARRLRRRSAWPSIWAADRR